MLRTSTQRDMELQEQLDAEHRISQEIIDRMQTHPILQVFVENGEICNEEVDSFVFKVAVHAALDELIDIKDMDGKKELEVDALTLQGIDTVQKAALLADVLDPYTPYPGLTGADAVEEAKQIIAAKQMEEVAFNKKRQWKAVIKGAIEQLPELAGLQDNDDYEHITWGLWMWTTVWANFDDGEEHSWRVFSGGSTEHAAARMGLTEDQLRAMHSRIFELTRTLLSDES